MPKSDITDLDSKLNDSNFNDSNFNDSNFNGSNSNDSNLNGSSLNNSGPSADLVAKKLIDVPAICQYPQLPTGCEPVAAAMVLQYYHVNITAEKFASDWLECDENFYLSGSDMYGPDPDKVFAGNPFTDRSYGCFAEAIVHAVNRNSTNCTAQTITDQSLEQLCTKYIDNDKPLLIWATMNMRESTAGDSWYFEDGTAFTWIAGEHCFVLVGYDDTYYFLNDPMSGSTVSYKKELADKRFAELGSQAVYISPNEM